MAYSNDRLITLLFQAREGEEIKFKFHMKCTFSYEYILGRVGVQPTAGFQQPVQMYNKSPLLLEHIAREQRHQCW